MKMDHYVFIVESGQKSEIAQQIAARVGKTLLFVRTRHGADKLVLNLSKAGVYAGALHSGKSQSVRNRTLETFKYRDSAVLVATDIAARGIHVDGIDLVVHVDVPADHKDYVHRSGRTARAGEVGTVVTLATKGQQKAINGILTKAGITASVMPVKPLDEQLISITGARKPSGIPREEEIPESIFRDEKPTRERSGNRGSRSRQPRSRDARRPREDRDSRSSRGSRDSRRSRDTRNEDTFSDRRETRRPRDSRRSDDSGFSRDSRDSRRGRDSRSTRSARDSRESTSSRGSRSTSRTRDSRETSSSRRSRDTDSPRSSRSTSRTRDSRETSSSRRSRDTDSPRSSRSTSRTRDSRDLASSRDTRGFRAKKSASKSRTTKTAVSRKRSGKPRPKKKSQYA